MKIKTKKAFLGYLFFSPWIIGFIIFTAYPFFYSLYLSFFNVRFKSTGIDSTFVGLKHYIYAFRGDLTFPLALTDTLTNIILSVPLILIFSLIIAILLNSQIKARAFFRLLYFLPVVIISGPVVSELVSNNAARIVDPGKYFIYKFFTTLPDRISFPFLYMFDNLVLILWFSGVQIIFFLAGLQKINSSIYEAAKIELASFANNSINGVITMHMFDIDKPYSYSSALSWIYFISIAIIIAITYLLLKERRKV